MNNEELISSRDEDIESIGPRVKTRQCVKRKHSDTSSYETSVTAAPKKTHCLKAKREHTKKERSGIDRQPSSQKNQKSKKRKREKK